MSIENVEPRIVERITRFRESQGLTYRQFAEALSEHGGTISGPTLQKIEKAGRAVRVSDLIVFSRALGVPVAELLGEVEDGYGGAADARLARIRELSQQITRVSDGTD